MPLDVLFVISYACLQYDTPLHESVRREDMATAQSLVAAGADVNASNLLEETPFSLAAHAGSSLRDFFEHHAAVLNFLGTDPAALVPAVVAHCAALSGLKDSVPAPKIQLSAHHLDPFFSGPQLVPVKESLLGHGTSSLFNLLPTLPPSKIYQTIVRATS